MPDQSLEDQADGLGAEGLCVLRQSRSGLQRPGALGPGEAAQDAASHLILQGLEDLLGGQHAQLEQGASFLDAAFLNLLGDSRVLLPADRAGVEKLHSQALAGQVRLGEDRDASLEPDGLLRTPHRELQRAFVALSPQLQQQARHGQTRELALLRNLSHRRSVSGDCGGLLR
jgi:hypothetical protein